MMLYIQTARGGLMFWTSSRHLEASENRTVGILICIGRERALCCHADGAEAKEAHSQETNHKHPLPGHTKWLMAQGEFKYEHRIIRASVLTQRRKGNWISFVASADKHSNSPGTSQHQQQNRNVAMAYATSNGWVFCIPIPLLQILERVLLHMCVYKLIQTNTWVSK